jgi:hypothetical protein
MATGAFHMDGQPRNGEEERRKPCSERRLLPTLRHKVIDIQSDCVMCTMDIVPTQLDTINPPLKHHWYKAA